MTKTPPPKSPRKRGQARELLLDAAREEFSDPGYFSTDTNKIAKRAGYAPQTFYRHFKDKIDIFIAVYDLGVVDGAARLGKYIFNPETQDAVEIAAFQQEVLSWLIEWSAFRQALRTLTIEEPRVREARARNRNRQIDLLASLPNNQTRSRAEIFAAAIELEALCDIVAFDIDKDMKVPRSDWTALIVRAARRVLNSPE